MKVRLTMLAPALAISALLLVATLLLLLVMAIVFSQLSGLLGRCEAAYRQLELHACRRSELLLQLADQQSLPSTDSTRARDACQQMATLTAAGVCPADGAAMQQLIAANAQLDTVTHRLLVAQNQTGDDAEQERNTSAPAELALVDSRLSFARQTYNDVVALYNETLMRPLWRMARHLGFRQVVLVPEPDEPATNVNK